MSSPMDIGALLRVEALSAYQAKGAHGEPVFRSATPLRRAVQVRVGADAAEFLAIPKVNERGDAIDWYAATGGDVIPPASQTPDERAAAHAAAMAMQARLRAAAAGFAATARTRDETLFAALLAAAAEFPDGDHVYLVNDRPVVTFWGFTHIGQDATSWATPAHTAPPPPPPAAPAAAAAAIPAAAPVPTGRRWPALAGCLPMVLLPLLAIPLLFGLRSCSPGLIEPYVAAVDPRLPHLFGWGEEPPAEKLPAEKPAEKPPEKPDGRPVTVVEAPGAVARADGGTVAVPAAPVVPALPPPLPVPDKATGKGADSGKDTRAAPGRPPPPPEPPEPSLGNAPDVARAVVPPPEPKPLVIPEDARRSGRMDFLEGRWSSRTGLVESGTNRPVIVDYSFDRSGQGSMAVRRADGTVCQGRAQAAMRDGKLLIDGQENLRCPDGTAVQRSQVECTVGDAGKAHCRGRNTDAQGRADGKQGAFTVEMQR